MNKERRKQIEDITGKIRDLLTELETCRDDEEYYRDSIPENLQGSERYEKADECVDSLTEAIDSIESALEDIDNCIE